jgi:hypothetical protein
MYFSEVFRVDFAGDFASLRCFGVLVPGKRPLRIARPMGEAVGFEAGFWDGFPSTVAGASCCAADGDAAAFTAAGVDGCASWSFIAWLSDPDIGDGCEPSWVCLLWSRNNLSLAAASCEAELSLASWSGESWGNFSFWHICLLFRVPFTHELVLSFFQLLGLPLLLIFSFLLLYLK